MLGTPLLILGDNPALPGGLARSCRDIASLACTLPEFRVGVLGRGLGQRSKLPWITYDYPESENWGEGLLEWAWQDFSGGKPGIILSTDDPSRRLWFSQGTGGQRPSLDRFLSEGRSFQKWGYFPIDGVGPDGGRLPIGSLGAVLGYDRVCAASEWGWNVLRNSGRNDADWLPHGLWPTFSPVAKAREQLGWENKVVVGCVMANQGRKDFAVAFEAAALVKKQLGSRFLFWVHTDVVSRFWDLRCLAVDYGLQNDLEITQEANDEQLAMRYSGCAVTILPSGGEGFGFPIAESLACGTGCIVADYSAGQEIVPTEMRARVTAWRTAEGNMRRAVLAGPAFAALALAEIERKTADWEGRSEELNAHVAHLYWSNLKEPWARWLKAGLR